MLTLIVNPTAGKGFALQALELLTNELTRQNIEFTVLQTTAPGGATEMARRAVQDPACKGVLAIGGDGTAS